MARFPKIDQPCPLDIETQKGLKGHCGQCGKTVHCLDGQSDAERAEFMRRASGPVCVTYRLGIGAALALSMAGPVLGAEQIDTTTNASPQSSASQRAGDPVGITLGAPASGALQSPLPDNDATGELELVFVGGVSRPNEAEWVDEQDASLPELPMRLDEAAR